MKDRIIDLKDYYRLGMYHRFTHDCSCSFSITSRIDVTGLYIFSKRTGTKFYINFLYALTKTLNSRDDFHMGYKGDTDQLIIYDQVNPVHYIFHDDTENFTPVYSTYYEDYHVFYENCQADIEKAKETRDDSFDPANHPNWFDASYVSWLSYDSLTVELPDGYPYFLPIVNWGKFTNQDGHLIMPVSIRLNHAVADGYIASKFYQLLERELVNLTRQS